jgi:hypothetical protein
LPKSKKKRHIPTLDELIKRITRWMFAWPG